MSVGRCPWIPRRYRGREIIHWLCDIGFMDQTVDTLPSPAARLACNAPVSGNDGGHDCNPVWLEERGAILVGRLRGCAGPHRDRLAGSRREPRVRRGKLVELRTADRRAHRRRGRGRTGGGAHAGPTGSGSRCPSSTCGRLTFPRSSGRTATGPTTRGSTRRSSTSMGGRCNGAASRMFPVSTSSVSTGCTRAGRPCSSGSATTPSTSSRTSLVARSG